MYVCMCLCVCVIYFPYTTYFQINKGSREEGSVSWMLTLQAWGSVLRSLAPVWKPKHSSSVCNHSFGGWDCRVLGDYWPHFSERSVSKNKVGKAGSIGNEDAWCWPLASTHIFHTYKENGCLPALLRSVWSWKRIVAGVCHIVHWVSTCDLSTNNRVPMNAVTLHFQ